MSPKDSQIRNFYKNQTIFLTGGTGFLGKILIEKLLRECWDLNKIYVLMRPKKNKTPEERFEEFFDHPCFKLIKSKDVAKKIWPINGDCNKPLLGLGDQDIEILKEETTCIIHAAANVKFDQSLKEACNGIRATKDLLDLAKQMPKLKVFVYISTAYSNCIHSHIKEEFYEPPVKEEVLFSLITSMDDNTLQDITPKLLGIWPNMYIFSKSISESLVEKADAFVPTAVVRPAIVMNTIKEPIPGWIDNVYGLVGLTFGSAIGIIRTFHAKKENRLNLVPVDCVSNCVLAAAWKADKEKATKALIYNYAKFQNEATPTLEEVTNIMWSFYWDRASQISMWYYFCKLRENKRWNDICVFFLHMVPAYLIDVVLFCLRKKTMAVRLYKKINKILDLTSYFAVRSFQFESTNVERLWDEMGDEDRRLFNFSMEKIDWKQYFGDCTLGMRLYLAKDPMETLPQGRRKVMVLCVLHYTAVVLFWFLMYKLLMFTLSFFTY